MLDHIVYDSFGNILTETNASNGDRFKFAGMQYDSTTQQYYDHARWYGSGIGRFDSQDPSMFAAGDNDLYRYVGNNSVNATDSSGLQNDSPSDAYWSAFWSSMWSGTQNVGTGISRTVYDLVTAPIDIAMTAVGIYNPYFDWKPLSYFGEGTQAAMNGGMSVFGVYTLLAANAASLGTFGFANAYAEYERTGDPTAMQQYAGSMLAIATVGLVAQQLHALGDNCFPAGTLVSTEDGLRKIEEIRSGEKVWAYNLQMKTWKLCAVFGIRTFFHTGDFAQIEVNGELIESTGNHPFWVSEGHQLQDRPAPKHVASVEPNALELGRWVDARDLRDGDLVLYRSGDASRIKFLGLRLQSIIVFNIQVSTLHTYAVGRNEVLVHNRSPIQIEDPQRPVYVKGHPGKVVRDHVLARAAGGADDAANTRGEALEANSRKGGYEGNLLGDEQQYVQDGLRPEQARTVTQPEWEALQNSPVARPMDPNVLDSVPHPESLGPGFSGPG